MKALPRVFLLSASALTVFRLREGQVQEAFAFDDTDAGHDGFARYLADESSAPAGLLVDRADEEFRVETVPHVWRGRAALVARQGARLFRGTPHHSAQVLGREAHGRRDDRVLFSALSRPEALQPWLERMARASVPLVAIESAAFLSARLLSPLGLKGSVLLALTGHDGLRQTVFIRGELQLSRLSPLPDGTPEARGHAVRDEIARTLQYLQRQERIPAGDGMNVHVVADTALAGVMLGAPAPGWRVHPLPEVAAALGCGAHATTDLRVLGTELMARAPVNRYARPEDRRHHLRLRALRAARTACGCGAVIALVAATYNTSAAFAALEATATARRHAAEVHEQTPFDDLRERAARRRTIVDAADRLLAARQPPHAALGQVGGVLARFPELRLDALTFADSAAGEEGNPNTLMGAQRTVRVRGHVVPAAGAPHLPARLDEFVAALRELPNITDVQLRTPPAVDEVSGVAREGAGSLLHRFDVVLKGTAP